MWLLFRFPVWFQVFLLNCRSLTVASDRISRAFNRSRTTEAVMLGISKALDRIWHSCLIYILRSYGISGRVFDLISSFLRRLRVVLDEKLSEEYSVNADVPQCSILDFILRINDLPHDVSVNIAIYVVSINDITLYSKFDQASDLW